MYCPPASVSGLRWPHQKLYTHSASLSCRENRSPEAAKRGDRLETRRVHGVDWRTPGLRSEAAKRGDRLQAQRMHSIDRRTPGLRSEAALRGDRLQARCVHSVDRRTPGLRSCARYAPLRPDLPQRFRLLLVQL